MEVDALEVLDINSLYAEVKNVNDVDVHRRSTDESPLPPFSGIGETETQLRVDCDAAVRC